MKALLSKEFKLCVHPALFIYLALILMLLIPNYPYLVSCFFVCNGIFFCFQQARENGDAMYTAMLPVSKAQAVKARVWFVVIIEIVFVIVIISLGESHGVFFMIVFGIIIVIIRSVISDFFHLLIGDASGSCFLDSGSYYEIRIGSHKALLKVIDKFLHILVTSVGRVLAALEDDILERIRNLGNKLPG